MAFGLIEALILASLVKGEGSGGSAPWQPAPAPGGGGGTPPPGGGGGGGWAAPGGDTGQACPPPPAPWAPCNPPSSAQVAAAVSMQHQLWATGCGSTIVQVTDGRATMYQANYVAPGKKGIVAYCMPADVEKQLPPGWTENLPSSDWQADNNAGNAQAAADAAAAAANALGKLADKSGDPWDIDAADDAADWADDAQDAADAAGGGYAGESDGLFDEWGAGDDSDWDAAFDEGGARKRPSSTIGAMRAATMAAATGLEPSAGDSRATVLCPLGRQGTVVFPGRHCGPRRRQGRDHPRHNPDANCMDSAPDGNGRRCGGHRRHFRRCDVPHHGWRRQRIHELCASAHPDAASALGGDANSRLAGVHADGADDHDPERRASRASHDYGRCDDSGLPTNKFPSAMLKGSP